ncbi:YrhB family protein [Pectobacterium peruviense]|uniref:YrhB family protein n=1 Tax=Pectobacterium peruviense TaxID=2066479 RepID=UPI000DE48824|nr:YrhB family protein [Pectobacterium peruviense]
MITFDEAVRKASEYLSDTDIPVVITSQGRFSEGWCFCFQSREYLETGKISALLAGNAPFIIDKDSGEIHSLGTAYPIEKYLQDYEEKKNNPS